MHVTAYDAEDIEFLDTVQFTEKETSTIIGRYGDTNGGYDGNTMEASAAKITTVPITQSKSQVTIQLTENVSYIQTK